MIKRRQFITLIGGAAAWPVAARTQQGMPVIAYLSTRSAESDASMLVALRRGLNEMGYAEGQNLSIEYRFADGRYDRVTAASADLIRGKPAVIIFAGAGTFAPEALRNLRASLIPIVFNTGSDPVRLGWVNSMNRPGANMTGLVSLNAQLNGKSIGLLHELLPAARTIAVLFDRNLQESVALPDARDAVATLGLKIQIIYASTESDIEAGFDQPGRADAMLVAVSPFFLTQARQIVDLARQNRIPTIYVRREFVDVGGLMSYGYDVADGYRQMGIYAGRILKGEKPADLPVLQPTKFELVINLKTANTLGLTVGREMQLIADEVIE